MLCPSLGINTEDGVSMSLQDVGVQTQDYTVQQPRRPQSVLFPCLIFARHVSLLSVQGIFPLAFYIIHSWLCSRHWETSHATDFMRSVNMNFRIPSNLNFLQWESVFLLSHIVCYIKC
jgi:hypothetical protein